MGIIRAGLALLLITAGCRMPQGGVAPRLEQEWKISIGNTISGDDFEVIGGTWTVDNGAIRSLGEQNNHPLWLCLLYTSPSPRDRG